MCVMGDAFEVTPRGVHNIVQCTIREKKKRREEARALNFRREGWSPRVQRAERGWSN